MKKINEQTENDEIIEVDFRPAYLPTAAPSLFKMKRWQLLLYAFLLPFVILFIVYAVGGFYPFGNGQIIVTDFWHQYYQVIVEIRDKLISGSSLLYSLRSGLGTNFLAMIAYYGASPFNFLSVFVPSEGLRLYVTFALFAKISLSGLTTAECLRYLTKKTDAQIVVFSTLFATCAYIMGYYWNIMWLDSIYMFPLVFLGLYKMIYEKKPLLYTVSLALCLIFNYYIGFFVCAGTVLIAIFMAISSFKSVKNFFLQFLRTLTHSLIAGGISAFMLIPAYLSLQNTYSVTNKYHSSTLLNGTVAEFFGALLPFQYPNAKDMSMPNLYAGVICLFLFIVFLFNRSFKLRERISSLLFLAIIFVTALFKEADYIINGFHYTNMIPYRYTFMFSFVLVVMAYRIYERAERIKLFSLIIAAIASITLAVFTISDGKTLVGIISIFTILIYFSLFLIYHYGHINRKVFAGVIAVLCIIESSVACSLGMSSFSYYDSYLANDRPVRSLVAEEEGEGFYRTEMSSFKTLNDPLLYGYYGISQFSSNANYGVSAFMNKIGLGGNSGSNRYTFDQTTPLMHSALALKYIISPEATNVNDTTLEFVDDYSGLSLYEYKYPLPIAYMTYGEANANLEMTDIFNNQNNLFKSLTGYEANIFKRLYDPVYEAAGVESFGGGNTSYTFAPIPDEKTRVSFTYSCDYDGLYYFSAKIPDIGSIEVEYEEGRSTVFSYKSNCNIIVPAGYHKAGETFTVSFEKQYESGNKDMRIYAAYFDEEIFASQYEHMLEGGMKNVEFSDTHISGDIEAKDDGKVFMSLPYEKGFRVTVNGNKTETFKYYDAFIGFEIQKGDNHIEISYTPDGFIPGALISIFSVLILLLACPIYYAGKIKKEHMI